MTKTKKLFKWKLLDEKNDFIGGIIALTL